MLPLRSSSISVLVVHEREVYFFVAISSRFFA